MSNPLSALLTVSPASALPWLESRRARARAAWEASGLPGRGIEAWRWSATALKGAVKAPYAPAVPLALDCLPDGALDLDAPRLVLVNGRLDAALSTAALPAGLSVQPLGDALVADPEGLEPLLGALLPVDDLPFAAVNTGLLGDGLLIRVRAGTTAAAQPLHVVWVAASNDDTQAAAHPRLLVIVERGAEAALVESYIALPGAPTLTNAATEISLADGARLRHVVLQNEPAEAVHMAATQAVLGRAAVYESFRLGLGARLARSDLRLSFTGEGAEARLDGAYALLPGQHHDTASRIDHAVPRCTSHQTYKGVVDARGRGVFQGKIEIARHAQHSAGHQLHKALLLAPGAEVDAKPELLIYADDVQCSHGTASGALDEDALFYLRARGVDEPTARTLLIEGFLDDVIDGVPGDAVQEALRAAVGSWLDRRKALQEAGQ